MRKLLTLALAYSLSFLLLASAPARAQSRRNFCLDDDTKAVPSSTCTSWDFNAA